MAPVEVLMDKPDGEAENVPPVVPENVMLCEVLVLAQ
jgi:hypothetical protein